ncbi:MAG TPA: heterodisulfide reductase-related iron-sulfur binding cluster [Rhodocyclaceae bacterium]|nr:Fe-S oxidoreductase [Rhodocyclaceae bacterium]HMV53911.1 heterodisulfide reductase-related iron-sulfur binding cluster [Rhodocyclaceae bacterium]HNA02992.1 heterodisulfide reductase-related iron-sulfur binding cluster [Rhodocyclaceae bacterium]HNB78064.1 heterodisulfide reductase-related iron-sulfur binding cluster [Rhodocyclaceae bacterium]HNC60515.1 heterodisulfide reductase-related iron-sulfur binding cluster [Rhodocyclaceae bacterium]
MTVREGSLEAPKRHPLDWKNPEFYDEEKLYAELERTYDICHGCRRCVSLCNAFPKLFDLIDEGESGELDSVPKQKYWDVVDQCYLCDMCFMTKCPYVPPHEWNLDFPHLMLRAKAVKFRKGEVRMRDKLLTSTDALGKLAAIPVVAQTVNAVNGVGVARSVMQSVLGVHKDRELPPFAPTKFRAGAKPNGSFAVRAGERAPGKVAIYSTCYVNYNEPGIGNDLLALLAHNEIPSVLVEKEACCGMPKLELGDLQQVERLKDINIPVLVRLAREGYAILAPIPSCALMFKSELPLMFPNDVDVAAVAEAMFDPFEYFMLRRKDGLLKTDFKQPLGKVSYHIPCHSRVQNIGQKTRETLQLVPDTTVNTVERCAGHDGTWGVKEEYFAMSMKIGRPVFRAMASTEPDYISSDCPIAGRHIQQGIRDGGTQSHARKAHPLTLLRIAYGI